MARKYKEYPAISLQAEDIDDKIDFSRIFGRLGGLHVEIGCGKGTFLLSQAQAQPDCDFLGIEWAKKYYRHAVDRIGRWGLTNVRIIRTDAAQFIAHCLGDDSVGCFHVYFPDPWPKKRHHKRRILSPANAEQLLRCLKTGGTIRIATDHAGYFQHIQAVLHACLPSLEQTDFTPAAGTAEGEYTGTNFERKYLEEQRPIYTIAVRKTRHKL